jgi:hypothetical protein
MAESKQYSLKGIESQLIGITVSQQQTLLSNILSFIAIERLAVNVTKNTQFQLNEDYTKVTITEHEPPAEDGIIETTVKDKQ